MSIFCSFPELMSKFYTVRFYENCPNLILITSIVENNFTYYDDKIREN